MKFNFAFMKNFSLPLFPHSERLESFHKNFVDAEIMKLHIMYITELVKLKTL